MNTIIPVLLTAVSRPLERFRARACFCTVKCEDGPNVMMGGQVISCVDTGQFGSFIDTHSAAPMEAI